VDGRVPEVDETAVAAALRAAGARSAFVHGSRAAGARVRPESDLDVGAWWGHPPGELPVLWDQVKAELGL
jgi:hypothetical protein